MNQTIQAIYENGLLRPLIPLDLPENSEVEITVRTNVENAETLSWKVHRALENAKLLSSEKTKIEETNPTLTNERREELSKIFSSETPLGDLIRQDRDERP